MAMGAALESEVNDIVGVLNSQYARLVEHVVTLLATPIAWQGAGMTSMANWVGWRTGVSPSVAASIVSIAERVEDLPESTAAFRRGELSLDQMAAIARRAPSWADAQSRDYATICTVPQLRQIMGKYPFPVFDDDGREVVEDAAPATTAEACTDDQSAADEGARSGSDAPDSTAADGSAAPSAAARTVDEFCSITFGDDGVFRLYAELDFDTGHIVASSLDEARDRMFHHGDGEATWVDALRLVAETSLEAAGDAIPARRNRFKVAMFINADKNDDQMVDATGWNVPGAIRQHVTCDGSVTPVFLDGGLPVSVGRAQHIVPARTRMLIERRDHGVCSVPGCTATLGLEVHHIVHWERGGLTDMGNLVLICGKHHRMHHRGRLSISGDADCPNGLEFRDGRGRVIAPSGASPNAPNGPPPKPACTYSHPLGERMDKKWIYFNPPLKHLERIRAASRTDAEYLERIQPPGF